MHELIAATNQVPFEIIAIHNDRHSHYLTAKGLCETNGPERAGPISRARPFMLKRNTQDSVPAGETWRYNPMPSPK
jgi:hypothetical protein